MDQGGRAITQELAQVYTALRKAGKAMEIVFVSADEDQASYRDHAATMPWPSLPVDDRRATDICERLRMNTLPCLAIVEASGKTLNANAVWRIQELGIDGFPWLPETGPVYSLTNQAVNEMTSKPCVILLCETQPTEVQRSLKERLVEVAKPFADTGIAFQYAFRDSEAARGALG